MVRQKFTDVAHVGLHDGMGNAGVNVSCFGFRVEVVVSTALQQKLTHVMWQDTGGQGHKGKDTGEGRA